MTRNIFPKTLAISYKRQKAEARGAIQSILKQQTYNILMPTKRYIKLSCLNYDEIKQIMKQGKTERHWYEMCFIKLSTFIKI